MALLIHPHARDRMEERGATEAEVRTTISKGVETRQISDEINIDISPDGKIYGIELLNAREQLIKEKKISFTDESTGRAFEVPLKF